MRLAFFLAEEPADLARAGFPRFGRLGYRAYRRLFRFHHREFRHPWGGGSFGQSRNCGCYNRRVITRLRRHVYSAMCTSRGAKTELIISSPVKLCCVVLGISLRGNKVIETGPFFPHDRVEFSRRVKRGQVHSV